MYLKYCDKNIFKGIIGKKNLSDFVSPKIVIVLNIFYNYERLGKNIHAHTIVQCCIIVE